MDDNRTQVAIWVSGFITLLVAIFLISGCVQKEAQIEAQAVVACTKMGGEWAMVRGTSTESTCIKKVQ